MRALATRLARTWRATRAAWSRAAGGEVVVLGADEAQRLSAGRQEATVVASRALDIGWRLVTAVGEAVTDERHSHRIRRERLIESCRRARREVVDLSAGQSSVRGAL